MDLRLEGAKALITGASKGIGYACAELLTEEGCDVAINGRDHDRLAQAADALARSSGRRVLGLQGDMSAPEDAERVGREAIEQLGGLDILITCAGSSPGGLIEELTEEHWAVSLGLKFLGYVRSCKAVLPHMREQGQRQHRPGGRQRWPEAELLGGDGRRRQRRRHQLRGVDGRAVRAIRRAGQHR